LREAQQGGERGRRNRLESKLLCAREVGGQERERAPREPEPEIAVENAAEQLEVVRRDEHAAGGDERQQPEVASHRDGDADRRRRADRDDGEGDEHPGGDARP
jgi:hypothetical protein